MFEDLETYWGLSGKWASKPIGCHLKGILNRCNGNCCWNPNFWPAKANTDKKGNYLSKCFYLGDKGCILAPEDKPITCLLFPFVLNKRNKLVLYGRAMLASGCCSFEKDTTEKMIIEDLQGNLTTLFGEDVYAEMLSNTKQFQDTIFKPPPDVVRAYMRERNLEENNIIPKPRTEYGS